MGCGLAAGPALLGIRRYDVRGHGTGIMLHALFCRGPRPRPVLRITYIFHLLIVVFSLGAQTICCEGRASRTVHTSQDQTVERQLTAMSRYVQDMKYTATEFKLHGQRLGAGPEKSNIDFMRSHLERRLPDSRIFVRTSSCCAIIMRGGIARSLWGVRQGSGGVGANGSHDSSY